MAGDVSGQISNWAGGGATTTLGAVQMGIGMLDDQKNIRPDYTIPTEVYQNLSQAELNAMEGMPAAQKQEYINNLQRNLSYALSQSSDRKGGLATVASLNDNTNNAYAKLLSMDAQARLTNQGILMNQRQNMADYKDQKFQVNLLNPYYERKQADQAMIGAGMQNMSQGFQASNSGANNLGQTYQNPNNAQKSMNTTNEWSNVPAYNYSPYVNTNTAYTNPSVNYVSNPQYANQGSFMLSNPQ